MAELNKCYCQSIAKGFHCYKNRHKAFSCYSDCLMPILALFYKSFKFIKTDLFPLRSEKEIYGENVD